MLNNKTVHIDQRKSDREDNVQVTISIKFDESCIKRDEFCTKYDGFCM